MLPLQARKKDLQLTMLNQFKQSMAGPDWEIEDYEWYASPLPQANLDSDIRKDTKECDPTPLDLHVWTCHSSHLSLVQALKVAVLPDTACSCKAIAVPLHLPLGLHPCQAGL